MDRIEIRPFESIDEFQKCVEFQAHTWGGHFTERVPIAILKVSQRLGGIASGAYDTKGQLVGFIFGMTGVQNGEVVHWSDMLAVKPELRNSGLGVKLKDYQRKALLAKGIRKMHWTFDPLESKNAYLNLNKLGATSKEYVRDIYGQTDSPLHSGIGTDRLVTTWILDSPRTIERIQSEAPNSEAAQKVRHLSVFEVEKKHGLVRPMQPNLNLAVPAVSIPIPLSIQSLKKASLELAVEWRVAVRDALTTYITEGYEVTDLLRREDYSAYLLLEAKRLG
ncbi:MAG: GNAT family N-acetyltransferase [Longimicrobiales bacterium]|nr:GNAT family N-acetyltransferase [Longimicrobiales bacterium]